jgi:4-amino-4-deoxy-L-arabinose transferase-like glycosyltransferase
MPSALINTLESRPRAAFAAFLALHGIVWIVLPTLLYANLPLDLIEALTYGREWQFGYDKLPPLPWWLVEIAYRVLGTDAAYYALGQASVLIAFTAVFATALPLVGGRRALIAILIIDGLHYFQFTAAKFNHDVVQLPLWGLAGYAFHAGLREGRLRHWVLLGGVVGLSLWAKYFIVMLAMPYGLFVLLDNQARKALARPGPWIAIAVAVAIMAPHIVWLTQNDFLPFAYAERRAAPVSGLLDHVVHPLVFAGGQLFFLLPALLIAGCLVWPRAQAAASPPAADAFDQRIITLLAFGSAASVLAVSALSGRGTVAMWGYPLWLFLGLWIVLVAWVEIDALRMARIVRVWGLVFAAFVLAFVADYLVLPNLDHRARAVLFPGDRLAAELDARYRAATGKAPSYVIASMWDGGNAAHYSAEHPQPRVLIDGEPRRAPWIDLADLKAKGALVVWTESDPKVLPAAFTEIAAKAEIGTPFELPYHRGGNTVHVGWAVLRGSGE